MIITQLLVIGSSILAGLSVGCSVTYPSVLLHQLASNESTIHLDLDTASWIGSIHGVTGIPSIIMPALMQWRGRKIAFIGACLVSILGWIFAYIASSSASILLSESIHGFGSHSVMAVGMLSLSEMLSPRFRKVSMGLYYVMQTLGMTLVDIVGAYLHWRTVSLIMSMPIIVAALSAFMWPESPAWLAYKGEFDKCTVAFTRLRGTSEQAKAELEELINAQKENLLNDKCKKQFPLKQFWHKLKGKDFYLPAVHIFILMSCVYWSGLMVVMIYSSDIVKRTTNSNETGIFGGVVLKFSMFVGCVLSTLPMRYYSSKKVLLMSSLTTAALLLAISAVNYCQTIGLVSSTSHACLYILIGYVVVVSISVPIVLTMSAELMPVKHRGVGGPLYVVYTCVLHSSSLKLAPYMFISINVWGTLLLYALNSIVCGSFVWICVPETNGKTLQQLEDYYAFGNFDKRCRDDTEKCLLELKPMKK